MVVSKHHGLGSWPEAHNHATSRGEVYHDHSRIRAAQRLKLSSLLSLDRVLSPLVSYNITYYIELVEGKC